MPSSLNVGKTTGQNRENIRQHNLSLVLRMLHQTGTVARSQLTSATGLNRSTISDLISELGILGLVNESEAILVGGVGRPSFTVSPASNVVAFAVNPEIDATTVGVVSLDGTLLHKVRYPTHVQPDPEEAARIASEQIQKLKAKLESGTRIAGIGAAVPGQVRVLDGVVRFAPHLGWVEAPFGPMLQQLTGLPVTVDNDAGLASMAERTYGGAKGSLNAVSLFAGSGGIGGGVIIGGNPLRGAAGYAGELGHMVISSSNNKDYSGLSGTLEAMVKRDDLLEAFKLFNATDEELHLDIMNTSDNKAIKLLNQQIDLLGIAIGNLANIFNPEVVILAGFLDSLFQFDQERLIKSVRASSLRSANERMVVRSSELGTSAALIGAAELAFGPLLSEPGNTKLHKIK